MNRARKNSALIVLGLLSILMFTLAINPVMAVPISLDPNYSASLLASGLSGPVNGLIYRQATNDLLVAEYLANKVSRIDATTGAVSFFASVRDPDEMAINSLGHVYVKQHPNGPIYTFDSVGTSISPINFTTPGYPSDAVTGIAFDSADNFYVAIHTTGTIYKYAAGTFHSPTVFASGFPSLEGIAFSPSGQLFVTDFQNGRVYEVTPGGTTLASHTLWASGLSTPLNFAFDPISGDVFISNTDTVVRISTPGGVVTTFASGFTTGGGQGTYDLDFDPAGNLYVDDYTRGEVWKFSFVPPRSIDKKVYVELLKNGDFSNGLACWNVRVENGANVRVYDGPTWLTIRPLPPGWTDIKLINEPGRTNVLDIIQTISDGDGDWTGAIQTLNRDVSGFSELYFEADGKAMFQSLAGDGWVGGEYPVHFIITYTDVNGVDHDTFLGWPPSPAWQQGFYYLAGNLPNEPYSNLVTQNVWFHYKSPNLMNLSPAPKIIKTVRLYSSGWAYHGRIDNAQLYGTPPSAELGDVIYVKLEVTVPSGETVEVVDRLPQGLSYIDGSFTVNSVPATPTITKTGPPQPIIHEISYNITESGTHLIEFDAKVDEAKNWEDTEVCNKATATWYDEEGNVTETMEDVECFTIHAFEQLHKKVRVIEKVKVIPLPPQFWQIIEPGVIRDVIVFDPPEITEGVALVRDFVVLHEGQDPFQLEALTWNDTIGLPWEPIDTPEEPLIMLPNEIAEYDIPILETDTAVLVRYTVAWASTSDVIEAHFINEAILESKSPQTIVGQLTNFDVHNDYHEPVDNFELELYGIEPSDIVWWFPGWGAPPQINPIPGGTEIIWIDPTQPVQPCQWVHFGLELKPDVIGEGVKAYWTQSKDGLTIKEKTNVQWTLEIEVSNPFCYTMTNVVITDRFGAEIEIDPPFPYSITHGTVSYYTIGNSDKLFLTWNIGNLLPGETARLIILVSTDTNPGRGDCNKDGIVNIQDAILLSRNFATSAYPYADFDKNGIVDLLDAVTLSTNFGQTCTGKQEYTEPGEYELNSGATLKFIDPLQNTQLSAYTKSIDVTVNPAEDP